MPSQIDVAEFLRMVHSPRHAAYAKARAIVQRAPWLRPLLLVGGYGRHLLNDKPVVFSEMGVMYFERSILRSPRTL